MPKSGYFHIFPTLRLGGHETKSFLFSFRLAVPQVADQLEHPGSVSSDFEVPLRLFIPFIFHTIVHLKIATIKLLTPHYIVLTSTLLFLIHSLVVLFQAKRVKVTLSVHEFVD